MFEQPFPVDLLQAAFVAAGRQELALAVSGNDVEEVASRSRLVAVDLYGRFEITCCNWEPPSRNRAKRTANSRIAARPE